MLMLMLLCFCTLYLLQDSQSRGDMLEAQLQDKELTQGGSYALTVENEVQLKLMASMEINMFPNCKL